MDEATVAELARLGGKPEYRAMLRDLPMPEKVRVIVELQKIAAPILRARGERAFVWSLDDETSGGQI
jgi:hypothetical protein